MYIKWKKLWRANCVKRTIFFVNFDNQFCTMSCLLQMLSETKEGISHLKFSNIWKARNLKLLFYFSYNSPSVIVFEGKTVPVDKIASPSVNVRRPTLISRPVLYSCLCSCLFYCVVVYSILYWPILYFPKRFPPFLNFLLV